MKTLIRGGLCGGLLLLTGCAHHHNHGANQHHHSRSHHYEQVNVHRHSNANAVHGRMHHSHYNDHGERYHGHSGYYEDQLQFADPYMHQGKRLPGWSPPANSYRPAYTHKLLADYAEQMTMKLVENMRYVSVSTPVAVASFVELDGSLGRTNILGNQLAESFITELQEFGIPVLDFKTTDTIHVGKNGDYVFSRNLGELNTNPGARYVLSGTMTYNDRGIIMNIRMVDVSSKLVVASTKGFIPQFVVDSLYPRNLIDGIVMDATE